MLEWTYIGVNHSLPGNGGPECVAYLGYFQRIVESLLTALISLHFMCRTYPHLLLPAVPPGVVNSHSNKKSLLLVLHCLMFGIEIGFKLATQQMIWILNPCHVVTMIQIFLLAAPPSRVVTAVFRLHMYMLSGAPLAILFPVINTRLLPFETEVYYIQHVLIMVVPVYLLRLGGVYQPESLCDFTWVTMALSGLYFYHFVPLHFLAVISQVNLNNMLCPAVSDPFRGCLYRICALLHQTILLPLLGKFLVCIARSDDKKNRTQRADAAFTDTKELNGSLTPLAGIIGDSENSSYNGHLKKH